MANNRDTGLAGKEKRDTEKGRAPARAPKASVIVASKPKPASGAGKAASGEKAIRFDSPSRFVSLFFFILSAYLLLSVLIAMYWPAGWSFLTLPGAWCLSRFGGAAFFLPPWFAAAAMLFYAAKFYPRLTFALASSSLPFLVCAGFARLSSEPGAFFENHPFFAAVGLSSLYAVLGFLLACSFAAMGLGLYKITLMMKEKGSLPDRKAKAANAARKPSALRRMRDRYISWREDRIARRSRGEIRLRTSEEMAAGAFDVDLPDLPKIEGLKSLDMNGRIMGAMSVAAAPAAMAATASTAPASAPSATATATATATAARGAGTAPESSGGDCPDCLNAGQAPAGADCRKIPQAAPASTTTFEASGKAIEFTSVPAQSPTGVLRTPQDPAEEAHRQELARKILERNKPKPYSLPVDGILSTYPDGRYWIIDDKTRHSAEILRETLAEFNIEAEVTGIRKGPVITMFEILPAHGVKISKITNLADNIALRLAASSVRIVAPIPGKHAVGIEVPNEKRAIVSLREVIENEQFRTAKMEIPTALGKDIAGEVQFIDLTQAPHLLIAGATGSGKSVCVNAIILSILYRRSPEEVKLMLIDPKIVELKLYNDIPHLLTPVITESRRAFQALQYCICEMERRYSILDKAGVRDIKSYNRKVRERNLAQEKLPYIVVIIDEFADLMATTGKELESTLARLAAMARAVGIHLVLATQRPSIDVITGLIKANIPSRIAFMVASKFDSRIIIDMVGAEKLLGRGDMLYSGAQDPFPVRMQGAYVSEEEVENAVEYVKTLGEPEYIDDEIFYDEEEESAEPGLFDGDGDPLFEKALEIVLQQGKASASFIQRRLKIGYNRAARLVELMEERGIVGPAQGSKPRELMRNPELFGRPDAARTDDRHAGGGREDGGEA